MSEKRVLVRVDFNSPIDKDGKIIDDSRIKAHRQTLLTLIDRGAAVVVITHQGRPGDDDFITLEPHAQKLEEVLGAKVKFVSDVIG
ncbi:MAG: phosphoglycerate kinase, partial [Zestosphaera sp.]